MYYKTHAHYHVAYTWQFRKIIIIIAILRLRNLSPAEISRQRLRGSRTCVTSLQLMVLRSRYVGDKDRPERSLSSHTYSTQILEVPCLSVTKQAMHSSAKTATTYKKKEHGIKNEDVVVAGKKPCKGIGMSKKVQCVVHRSEYVFSLFYWLVSTATPEC